MNIITSRITVLIFLIVIVLATVVISIYVHENKGRKTVTPIQNNDVINSDEISKAYFAGGCFWCVESDFEKIPAVENVISGYMGGSEDNPTYEQVSAGKTNHRESVEIIYNPKKVTYEELVRYFFRHVDPTDSEGSFFDRGNQYTSAIYYSNEEEKNIAEKIIKALDDENIFGKKIVTSLEKAGTFWQAEDYHQDYYKKNPLRYKYFRTGSGRDAFIEKTWQDFEKPSDDELKQTLTPIQYKVTQQEGTEKPFDNEYWNNHEAGIYVDIVSGEPLFSSTDKYDSGTGWPSFLKPININFVTETDDYKLLSKRIEIRSAKADSHLGHIIMDGPKDNDYVRYCMNSAAMNFIPKEEMEEKGYGEYLYLYDYL